MMKKLLLFTLLATGLMAADAPDDLIITQAKNPGPGNIQRNVAPTARGFFSFDGSKVPVSTTDFTYTSPTLTVPSTFGITSPGSITLTPAASGAINLNGVISQVSVGNTLAAGTVNAATYAYGGTADAGGTTTLIGLNFQPVISGSNNATAIRAFYFQPLNSLSSGTLTNEYGSFTEVRITGAGNTTNGFGSVAYPRTGSTGAFTNFTYHLLATGIFSTGKITGAIKGISADDIGLAGATTVTVFNVADQTKGSGDAVAYSSSMTSGTGKYSIKTSTAQVSLGGLVTTYNGLATAGNGLVSVQGAGRATAQTAANASVATYTVGASDASFVVSANVRVTTSSAEAFTVTCAYTDEGNTARTITLNFQLVAGTIGTAIAAANGAVPYEGLPLHIRAKAATAITIATTGTFTGCTYNVEGVISKLQ